MQIGCIKRKYENLPAEMNIITRYTQGFSASQVLTEENYKTEVNVCGSRDEAMPRMQKIVVGASWQQ